MNFITFPVATTNIWPASNAVNGGQLVTEWNIRSRETVGTDPAVNYSIGPSFVHGETDFYVDQLKDVGDVVISPYILHISEGRALINGHYVETLAPMTIDLVEANIELAAQSRPILKGNLAIGIRAFYATEQTVAGSILVENEDNMYLGVQLVVLPEDELITPSDSPTDQSKVTADIRLATFVFMNNNITNITNLSSKLAYVSATRITDLDRSVFQSKYVSKVGLNPKKIYTFAGKGVDPETGADTWEDSTDSLIIWDNNPQRTLNQPLVQQAEVVTTSDDAYLVLPHKQVEGMTDQEGNPEYYASRIMSLPIANYATNTVGFVNKAYTQQIKDLASKVSEFRSSLQGKQIYFMEERDVGEQLPAINPLWNVGDYILVAEDLDYVGGQSDTTSNPATMYVVLPGQVLTIGFVASVNGDVNNDAAIPSNIDGAELAFQDWYEASGQAAPDTTHPEYFPTFFDESDTMLGVPKNGNRWNDYFRVRYFRANSATYAYTDYFYGVLTSGPRKWSDAILVTGAIGLATETEIGGFLNASPDVVDNGYVRVDDSGHLVLTDYELLRSGTLAYQIAQDLVIPESTNPTDIQTYLNEFVNDRVAFPSSPAHGVYSPILNITITLPTVTELTEFTISGIDCRFNTAIYLHIRGSANSKTVLNIIDCEKLIIDSQIGNVVEGAVKANPVINVIRSNLYYDPVVMDYIRTCDRADSSFSGFQDLTLWYEQLDPDLGFDYRNLAIDGMTITELDAQVIPSEINYWNELGTAINDNHYLVALKSITFSGSGDMIGCSVLVANNSTDNILPGDKIVVGNFTLPQGSSLIYPTSCLTHDIKVSGEFTSAYYSDSSWYVTNNSFSLDTGVYSGGVTSSGTVAFHSVTTLIPSSISQTSISVWESDSYHVFTGGVII